MDGPTGIGGIPEVRTSKLGRRLVRGADSDALIAAEVKALPSESLRVKFSQVRDDYVSRHSLPSSRKAHGLSRMSDQPACDYRIA